ncbi:hypothetical protein C9374_000540 [Naegleria lovaniensis]|uniref:Uncharacterized protein n=1 Tax=Naegleria lovaniensis TaxID=51637 RepID=A0AA88KP82_NAELO|nr:uncharacterized protein C9374_000540 [Naegleria lovaniensis]KAG2388376.1 hypothetical protein C9374_000540 [Naegleria lovaniensis]
MIENFYGVARQHCGSNTNLNAENFLNALNNFLSALIVGLQFNKEKDQSTRLPYEYYCCFPSPEHINYIVIGEFERACRTFAMLSDAEYEAPTIHTLLFNLNIPGIEVLLTKEFKLKQYSNNDIVEFDKLEQQWNRTHQPHNMLQNFKNKQSNAHITIGGIIYHKQQLIRQVTFSHKTSCDVSRYRRFDKRKPNTISQQSNSLSWPLYSQLTSQEQIEKPEANQTLNSEYLSIGDYVLQLDENNHVFICQIKQIKQWTKRTKKNKKPLPGWEGEDYLYSIKWEYRRDTKMGELNTFRFFMKTFVVNEADCRLIDVSKDFTQYYEEFTSFPRTVIVENGFLCEEERAKKKKKIASHWQRLEVLKDVSTVDKFGDLLRTAYLERGISIEPLSLDQGKAYATQEHYMLLFLKQFNMEWSKIGTFFFDRSINSLKKKYKKLKRKINRARLEGAYDASDATNFIIQWSVDDLTFSEFTDSNTFTSTVSITFPETWTNSDHYQKMIMKIGQLSPSKPLPLRQAQPSSNKSNVSTTPGEPYSQSEEDLIVTSLRKGMNLEQIYRDYFKHRTFQSLKNKVRRLRKRQLYHKQQPTKKRLNKRRMVPNSTASTDSKELRKPFWHDDTVDRLNKTCPVSCFAKNGLKIPTQSWFTLSVRQRCPSTKPPPSKKELVEKVWSKSETWKKTPCKCGNSKVKRTVCSFNGRKFGSEKKKLVQEFKQVSALEESLTMLQENGVNSSTTAENEVSSSATAVNEVNSSTTAENEVNSSTIAENGVSSSTTAENGVSSSTTAENGVSSSTTAENGVSSSTTAENGVNSSTIAENEVSSSMTAENGVNSSTTAESKEKADDTIEKLLKQIYTSFSISNEDNYFVRTKKVRLKLTSEQKKVFERFFFNSNHAYNEACLLHFMLEQNKGKTLLTTTEDDYFKILKNPQTNLRFKQTRWLWDQELKHCPADIKLNAVKDFVKAEKITRYKNKQAAEKESKEAARKAKNKFLKDVQKGKKEMITDEELNERFNPKHFARQP